MKMKPMNYCKILFVLVFTELTSLCYSQNADETIINFYKITFNDLTGSKNYSFKSYATGKIIEGKHDPLPLLNAIDLLTYEVTVTEHNIQPTWVVCMQFRLNALKKISMLENYDKLVVQIDGIYYAEITAKALKEIIKDKLELNVALDQKQLNKIKLLKKRLHEEELVQRSKK